MKLFLALLVLASVSVFSFAQTAPVQPQSESKPESKKSLLRTWFEHLKKGLSESSVQHRYQRTKVTAVAAVRGDSQTQSDPNQPEWKGSRKARKDAVLRKERAEFAKAVDLIMEGKTEEGVLALDSFEKAHPKSSMLGEVREAREKAKELSQAE